MPPGVVNVVLTTGAAAVVATMLTTRACASSRSPAPPRSARAARPGGDTSSTPRWSSAGTRRSSCSRTPTRRRARGRHGRQDAQRRGGLHRREPLPRPRVARRRSARGSPTRWRVRMAPGTDPGAELGPMINEAAVARSSRSSGRARPGARVTHRRRGPTGPGWFYPPTVLDSRRRPEILREEVFGPVAPVRRSPTRPTRSPWPTTPSTDSSRTSIRATYGGRCAWRRRSRPGWSA